MMTRLIISLFGAMAAVQMGGAENVKFIPQFSAAIAQYGFSEKAPLESGSKIVQFDDRVEVTHPSLNSTEIYLQKSPKLELSDLPKQWLAWYFKSCLSGTTKGFESFSSDFIVPPLPKAKSNLAIFNGLQASYDPTSYNWILQPVLMHGTWMAGDLPGWGITSCLCPQSGSCLFTKPVTTQPGNLIRGVMTLLSGSPNSYQFEVNITDITAGTPTQTIHYSSKYFAQWAFVTLEHNPEGKLTSCDQLPPSANLAFTNNKLKPTSMDTWQGSQTDMTCGLSVQNFVYGDSSLVIGL